MKNIAFLSPNWSYSVYALDLAQALAAAGLGVYLYYDAATPQSIDWKAYAQIKGLTVKKISCDIQTIKTPAGCKEYLGDLYNQLLAHDIGRCHALVGIEKIGSALAFITGRALRIPHAHWSLELYDKEHSWAHTTPCADYWLEMEALSCKAAQALIIQDAYRAAAFENMVGFPTKNLFLPLTLNASDIVPAGGNILHTLFGISPDMRILFQFGQNRLPEASLLHMAEALPPDWVLALHGMSLGSLQAKVRHPKLFISAQRLPHTVIPHLVAGASAGLVHYEQGHINNTLTAWSSEKLSRYLCAGIPVIAHNVGNYHALFDKYACGVLYTDPAQVRPATQCIAANPLLFHQEALRAGNEYSLAHAGKDVVNFLCHMAGATDTACAHPEAAAATPPSPKP